MNNPPGHVFPELAESERYYCFGSEYSTGLEVLVPLTQVGQETYCDFTDSNITTVKKAGISMCLYVIAYNLRP